MAYVDLCHCSPEGLDDVGGYSGPALVRVGLPGEGDGVLGHLRHYRLLRRPRKLNELRHSGYWRESVFCYVDRKAGTITRRQ